MPFDPQLIAQAHREIDAAPYGFKGDKVRQWATLLGVAPQTIHAMIADPTKKKPRKSAPRRPELQDWARIVFKIKKMPPTENGEISTEDAIALAIEKHMMPCEAAMVPVATYNTIARKNGWTKKEKRRNRIRAARPNDCHHFDASTSKFLYIARRDKVDPSLLILRLHRAAKHYKNKPIPVDQLRPWIYGIADDHSTLHLCRYVAALGENSGDSMEFLCWAWSILGLPTELGCDMGMLKKAFASRDWVDNLGVLLPDTTPYEKDAHGKIERPWRTLWKKFELLYFADREDYEKFEISMSELNQELSNYTQKYNSRSHPLEKSVTRQQAWNRVNLNGGIVKIPERALATAARRASRTVDVTGKLEYPGGPYEVLGLHKAEVWVWEKVFGDKIVVQDKADGKKYEVRAFETLDRGEFRSHPETPHEKLIKEIAEMPAAAGRLYAEKKADNEKVAQMPIKIKEERKIEDHFDVHHYANVADAFRGFFEVVGPRDMQPSERRDLEKLFKDNDLSKDYVRDLALDCRAWYEQRLMAAGQ